MSAGGIVEAAAQDDTGGPARRLGGRDRGLHPPRGRGRSAGSEGARHLERTARPRHRRDTTHHPRCRLPTSRRRITLQCLRGRSPRLRRRMDIRARGLLPRLRRFRRGDSLRDGMRGGRLCRGEATASRGTMVAAVVVVIAFVGIGVEGEGGGVGRARSRESGRCICTTGSFKLVRYSQFMGFLQAVPLRNVPDPLKPVPGSSPLPRTLRPEVQQNQNQVYSATFQSKGTSPKQTPEVKHEKRGGKGRSRISRRPPPPNHLASPPNSYPLLHLPTTPETRQNKQSRFDFLISHYISQPEYSSLDPLPPVTTTQPPSRKNTMGKK